VLGKKAKLPLANIRALAWPLPARLPKAMAAQSGLKIVKIEVVRASS
jgi:hypothetical protein